MKYSVMTFGCRVNQADSLVIEEDLLRRGAMAVPPQDADLVIVNTCSVTASADQGARQAIRRVSGINPTARIVVTGCYATRRPDEVAALPNVLRVVRNADKERLTTLVAEAEASLPEDHRPLSKLITTAERFGFGEGSCGASIGPGVAGRTAFTLRVQTGCSEPCSYCIIPATRGTPRSVPWHQVREQIRRAVSAGFKEIALTGVHLGSYGRDLHPRSSLFELLAGIENETRSSASGPAPLFRVSSLEPMDCTKEIVSLFEGSESFAPHFHLPLQHASNRLLGAMRRPYQRELYADLVNEIRERIPNAAIGSDVIVGFPGETDRDFEELESYLAQSPLTHLHVFPYSDRPGTEAAAMGDRAPGPVIRERARQIREVSERLSRRFRESQIGQVYRALTLDDGSVAVTANYLKVRIPPAFPRNEWVTVRITSKDDGELLSR